MARPSEYTQQKADEICSQLADGLSLRTICLADEMPDKSTVFRWLRQNEEFRNQYARAKEESADALVEEMLDIVDDGSNDWMQYHDREGNALGWKENGEALGRSRLRLDARKWIVSKLKPKRYGDSSSTVITGPDGGPVQMAWPLPKTALDQP